MESPALKKAPLSESGKDQTILKSDFYDPNDYPLVEMDSYAGYLIDSWYTTHYVYFNSIQQSTTASNMKVNIQIFSDNDYAYYKDMYYTVEFFKNYNDQLSFYSANEYSIDETNNNWILTSSEAKSNFSDQEYIYIRLGSKEYYSSEYYNDTTLFKVSNPYYVPPVDTEALNNFVTRFYQLCLNRTPDQSGLSYYVNRLATKTITGADISNSFIFSPEFVNKNVADGQFIDIMYNAFFDRSGDSSGNAYWMDKLANGMSRLYVLSCFVNSTEFSTICNNYGIDRGNILLTKPADLYPKVTGFVYRFYDRCLERNPDDTGLNYWVNRLIKGQSSGSDLANSFVLGAEFTERNLSNADFISIMYRVFFNRESDTAGMTYWLNKLSAGTSRRQVLNGFVNSKEFSVICSNYEINVK